MKQNWVKWILPGLLVLVFSLPAWAVELKLGGTYEMQGRYYTEKDIVKANSFFSQGANIGAQEVGVIYNALNTGSNWTDDDGNPTGISLALAGLGLNATQISALQALATTMPSSDPYVASSTIRDTMDNDKYIKHYFSLSPQLIINDRVSINMDLEVFDNALSDDEYPEAANDDYDNHTIFRVQNLWADVLTDYGKFLLGKTPAFMGIGYFIKLPDMEDLTLGLIWSKIDEDGDNRTNALRKKTTFTAIDSDSADENAVSLLAIYEAEKLAVEAQLAYGWSGSDNSESSAWVPQVKVNYNMDNVSLEAFANYKSGTFVDKGSNVAMVESYVYQQLLLAYDAYNAVYTSPTSFYSDIYLGSPQPKFAKDWEFGGYSAYVEAAVGLDMITPKITLAYASGSDKPNEVSGSFADDVYFGSWLMNDVSDKYAQYFETPTSTNPDGLGDPGLDDYSFSNIMLVRLGADAQLSEKLSLSANLIWAKKASTDYLEKWNPEYGTLNALNPAVMTIAYRGQYGDTTDKMKNNVDDGLGWEVNAELKYKVQDNFTFALQGAYYAPGDFYESALEDGFATAAQKAANPLGTGLSVEDHWAARWKAKVSF